MVSCIKHGVSRDSAYFIMRLGGSVGTEEMDGTFGFEAGDFVDYGGHLDARLVENPAQAPGDIRSMIDGFTKLAIKNSEYRTGNPSLDALTHRMWQRLGQAASMIVRKMLVSAPIIVRFHNDADGSSGAYSLYLSAKEFGSAHSLKTNFVWLMQKGVSYSVFDSENDILIANNYSCIEKPLLVLIDFGTNTDSNLGLKGVRDRFDIVWLDHHPLVPGFAGADLGNYINTWQFGGDSNYTAGLLTAVMCKAFSGVDTSEFEGASLIGDYSSYATSAGYDMSSLLDFITSDLQAIYGPGKSNVTPQEIESIISDRDRSRELLEYANIKLEEAIDRGINSIKRYSLKNSNLAVLDFEEVRSEDSKYPLPGRFASKLLDKLDDMGMTRTILVVSVGAYLLMRIDRELCKELDLLKIMNEMKSRYPDDISGGGGHRCAGSIKLRYKELSKDMTGSLVNLIKSELGPNINAVP